MQKIDVRRLLPFSPTKKWPAVSLQAVLSILLFAVVLAVGSLLTILNYQRGRDMANSASSVLFEHIEREMALQLDGLYRPISQLVDLTLSQALATDKTLQQRLLHMPALAQAMRHNPGLSAIYVGYANGDFFQIRKLKTTTTVLDMAVPPGAVFLVQSNGTGVGGNDGLFLFLAEDLRVLGSARRADYGFDPRRRDWYRQAMATPKQIQTKPYMFFSTNEPGITVARRSVDKTSVIGADISLSDLSAMLGRQNISPSAELALADESTAVLAYQKPEMMIKPPNAEGHLRMTMLSELGGKQFAALADMIHAREFNKPFDTNIDGRLWSGRIVPVRLGGSQFYLAISVPEDELLADARHMLNNGLLVTLFLLLAAIPLAAVVAWRLGLPLRRLAAQAEAMQDLDFSRHMSSKSRIHEIELLASSMNETRLTIHRFTDENKQLLKEQADLLEAMIQVIAGAIDAKSPYTGGHCQRVPELTKMLAHAACDAEQGPFQHFNLNEDQWQEVHVASWLHDCGKMTTPEFVVDKATKLETIVDRLHEIRMRFEVIKRDRHIAALQAIAGGADAAAANAALAQELAQLDEEFAFIASCNEGSEFMAPEMMLRVKQIAQRTWLRTLDDRIGISWEERQRKSRIPAPELPVLEPLLSDRADHEIVRRDQDRLAPDNKWGFKVDTPELLYNRGEIYNLCIKRGTLTEEERYKINEHMIQTIIMLSRLPFPRHLANVPEIAGGHHERMDGNGYPKRLKREQMSPVARMMAVADIFEALTAADRPYKKGKKLSEAIAIMVKMKNDGHIDPDVFDLFFESGIYLRYAEKYMAAELIDSVVV